MHLGAQLGSQLQQRHMPRLCFFIKEPRAVIIILQVIHDPSTYAQQCNNGCTTIMLVTVNKRGSQPDSFHHGTPNNSDITRQFSCYMHTFRSLYAHVWWSLRLTCEPHPSSFQLGQKNWQGCSLTCTHMHDHIIFCLCSYKHASYTRCFLVVFTVC